MERGEGEIEREEQTCLLVELWGFLQGILSPSRHLQSLID